MRLGECRAQTSTGVQETKRNWSTRHKKKTGVQGTNKRAFSSVQDHVVRSGLVRTFQLGLTAMVNYPNCVQLQGQGRVVVVLICRGLGRAGSNSVAAGDWAGGLCFVAAEDWAGQGNPAKNVISCRRGLGRGRSEKPLRPLQNPFKSRPLYGG